MTLLERYRRVPVAVLLVIGVEFLGFLLSAGLTQVFNLYLRRLGYDDAAIGQTTSFRFVGTFFLALPVGIFLRGRRIKPLLVGASVLLPFATWVVVAAAEAGRMTLVAAALLAWGVGLMSITVAIVPFILRATDGDSWTEAIALRSTAFPLSLVACGLVVNGLSRCGRVLAAAGATAAIDEGAMLRVIIATGCLAIPLALLIREPVPTAPRSSFAVASLGRYDWSRIARAAAPTLAISVGAGLTIPYVALYFNSVFGLDAAAFSALGAVAGVLVMLGALINPYVQRRFGYMTAIALTQSLAVFFLLLLAATEPLRGVPGMVWVAAVSFALRQPLMNMAGPISIELAMSYVGPANRELMSALTASIWSGSWFVSAKIFQYLRAADVAYSKVFVLTSLLYVVGILLYVRLIRAHRRDGAADAIRDADLTPPIA